MCNDIKPVRGYQIADNFLPKSMENPIFRASDRYSFGFTNFREMWGDGGTPKRRRVEKVINPTLEIASSAIKKGGFWGGH